MAGVMSRFLSRFRCSSNLDIKDRDTTERTSWGDSSPTPSSISTVVNPVALIDAEGFEWAMDDGPPRRPSNIPEGSMFIPFAIRPSRGFLKNQVLTDCEVPDLRSPVAFSGPLISIHTEQVLRRLRARSVEVCESTGAHLRSRSGKHLIRRDLVDKDREFTAESISTTTSSDRLKPPSQRIPKSSRTSSQSSPVDVKTYLAMRARMAAHRK
jgi:hypothetical protein